VKKTLIIVALGIAAVATLTGCSAPAPAAPGTVTSGDNKVWTNSVNTSAGAVDCVFYDGFQSSAVQCDWANVGKAMTQVFQNGSDQSVGVVQQKIQGQSVDCVFYDGFKSGGLSCNLPSVQK
jgi:hypothetical protein